MKQTVWTVAFTDGSDFGAKVFTTPEAARDFADVWRAGERTPDSRNAAVETHEISLPDPADKFDAMAQIQQLAQGHDLAVSIVTVEDVLSAKGMARQPTRADINAVVNSWEWRHYHDGWPDWFENFEIGEQ